MSICKYESVTAHTNTGQELRNITIELTRGESLAVLGTNGSGKSLMGKLFAGELPIVAGTASPAKRSILLSFERIAAIIEEDFIEADITEATILNPGLTALDLIKRESGMSDISPELIERFNLTAKQHTAIRHLSTGEIAKSLLIAALLAEPDLLILDEPYDGLDVESRSLAAAAIDSVIDHGTAVVLILNRIEEIPSKCNRIAILDHAEIILCGERDQILHSETMHRLFDLHHLLPDTLPGESRKQEPKTDSEGRLVSFRNVTVQYGDSIVLNGINWDLIPGEHWQISGPNGCGKSTLLSLISGDHQQAYCNDITLFGTKRGSGETVWDIKQQVGIVSALLQRDYRVGGSLLSAVISGFHDSIGLYVKSSPKEEREAHQWLAIAGMQKQANLPFRRLSYGEQRMALILRAMVKRPAVLVLDEPCLGLDPINRQLVLNLVNYIGKTGGTTILYVTHHDEDRIESIHKRIRFIPAVSGGFTLALSDQK